MVCGGFDMAVFLTDLFAARSQMAVSLGFHIIFSCIGIAMPFFMAASHAKWLLTKEQVYFDLTKAWLRGVAIFFAVGAVSGTVLSFELGLLWPEFMKHAGPIVGLPFSMEGTAFFLEAIAIGIYLYGWGKLPPWLHWSTGIIVGLSGVASAFFVICANGWMNAPAGFIWENGAATNIDPIAAMFNKAAIPEAIHMVIAAFEAVGFAVAGVHAWRLLRNIGSNNFHKKGMIIALFFASIFAIIQPLSGDMLAKVTAQIQPLKLAAMEAHYNTETPASLLIGGVVKEKEERVDYAIKIPALLSFLSYGDFHATVKGIKDFPKEERPPIAVVHYAFVFMIMLGSILAVVGATYFFLLIKKRATLFKPWFLKLLVLLTPTGFLAIEAGWVVTEVGRQPWIIYGIMKTKDSLTPMPGLFYPFVGVTILYLFLSFVVTWLLYRQILKIERENYA